MSYFDIFVFVLIALYTIRGIYRGFINELVIILSVATAFVFAFAYLDFVVKFVNTYISFIPLYVIRILTFIIAFSAIHITLRIVGSLLNKMIKMVFMQPMNRFIGGLLGFFKGSLTLSILILFVSVLPYSNIIFHIVEAEAGESITFEALSLLAPAVYNFLLAIVPGSEVLNDNFMQAIEAVSVVIKNVV